MDYPDAFGRQAAGSAALGPSSRAVPFISRSAADGRVHPCRRGPTISTFDGFGREVLMLDWLLGGNGMRMLHCQLIDRIGFGPLHRERIGAEC